MGYNYPGQPVLGSLLMVVFTILLAYVVFFHGRHRDTGQPRHVLQHRHPRTAPGRTGHPADLARSHLERDGLTGITEYCKAQPAAQ